MSTETQEVKTELKLHDDWFSNNIPLWEKHLAHLRGKSWIRALEIGCWEGRSTVWMLQNVLNGQMSSIDVVDTFRGNPENPVLGYEAEVEANFWHNVDVLGARECVRLHKRKSHDVLPLLPKESYDLIYIDGSHDTKDVLLDLCLSWLLLKSGGIMIMDDYEYRYSEMGMVPGMAIDAFYTIFKKDLFLLWQKWQVAWRKI